MTQAKPTAKQRRRRSGRGGRRTVAAVCTESGASSQSVHGDLELFGLPEIIQTLTLGMKTACVVVRRARRRGRIWFENGAARHASTGKLRGDDAFFEIMSWREGSFSIERGRNTRMKSLSSDALYLLMEGARRLDESSLDDGEASAPAPPASAAPSLEAAASPGAATKFVELTQEMRDEIDALLLDLAPGADMVRSDPTAEARADARVRLLSARAIGMRTLVAGPPAPGAGRAAVATTAPKLKATTARAQTIPDEVQALRAALFG